MNTTIIKFISGLLLLAVIKSTVVGQNYKVGDLYTFSDGTQGIVFHVNPENPTSGTAAALHDLAGTYAIWTGGYSTVPVNAFQIGNNIKMNLISTWMPHGHLNTQLLKQSGVSPAGDAMDIENGWYIPDLYQMRRLHHLASVLSGAFALHGGNYHSLTAGFHWTSSIANTSFYRIDSTARCSFVNGTLSHYIRPVRDFSDDSQPTVSGNSFVNADTVVRPDTTTTYYAHLFIREDTLEISSAVTVFTAAMGDTFREIVSVSPLPYNSPAHPLFQQIDISQPGDYISRQTIPSTTGCDSIITLLLTVLPTYEVFDTVKWCMYEKTVTRIYDHNYHVTISVQNNNASVVSTSADITIEEVNIDKDYLLKMKTVHGGDSLLYLHLNIHEVTRDTILYELPIADVIDDQVIAACRTFSNIDEPGTYTLSDTLIDIHGCDSIVTVILTVKPCELDFSITCPPDIYDTLAFGDCVMAIYPERIGMPAVIHNEEWPFRVGNDLPEEMLFAEGETVVTWIVTDSICGISKECQQRVFIAFPQCPEAVDCEGNVYQSVRIGCDCWTQRNLESTKYSDCIDIPDVYEYASWKHPDTMANVAIYGRHYTFEAAVRDSSDNGHGHIQGICPDGWYLPTPEKFAGLNVYDSASLKSPHYWIDGGGHNSTGFSALPAGFFNGEKNRFEGLLTETYFWSSQIVDGAVGESLFLLRHHCDEVLEVLTYDGLGYSIRCIKER